MRGLVALFHAGIIVAVMPGAARDDVAVEIDVGGQSMDVHFDGAHRYFSLVASYRLSRTRIAV